ncbi:head-tail adaptor protein [Caldifermentibacillus hisashii]|uniref:phage head completion protein n=1 Tax=Caldifermentibacillus hisashii TaxID=996558 RepID=UPI0031FD6232
MNTFQIQQLTQIDDGIGGYIEDWTLFKEVQGYLDLVTGTDLNSVQNAIIEQSTHLLIIPEFTVGITDKMRVVDENKRYYTITYSDDPMGVHHHNEIYCKFGGVLDGI